MRAINIKVGWGERPAATTVSVMPAAWERRLHALIHMIVENQVALGDETPVAEAVVRLMQEGLDRHDAVHAVGSVLAGYIWKAMQRDLSKTIDPNVAYYDEIRGLTAQKWREQYGDMEQ
jgi:hypothetical protein